jgi:sensor histidine kinase YesM
MAAVNIAAAIFVVVAFSGVGLGTPWRSVWPIAGVALLFSTCIGTPCALLLPRISPTLWRLPFPLNWLGLVVVMFVISVLGSMAAIGVLVLVGYVAPAEFAEWVLGSFKYSLITTLTFGLAVSAYEVMRSRLEHTTVELRTKERDEAEARRLASEAQLASLEARVQPHFLFNTLNSIASLIHNDPKGAEKMTGQLASILRSSLDDAGALVPLEQELKTVRDYLDIERVRFGDRLRYTIQIDERVAAALVPRLSVQTLVENAVKYAVSPRRDGGTVAVIAGDANGRVRLAVEDDGPGFDSASVPDRHGITLVRERLALTFGDRGTLSFESRAGMTRAVIEVPRSG